MKRFPAVSLSLLSIGLALSAASLLADDTPSTPPPTPPANPPASPGDGSQPTPPPEPHHRRMRGYVLADLTAKLGLTADQQKAIGAIIENTRSQGKAVRDDDTLSKDDRRAKMMEIMKAAHDQIRAALTPDQQATFDAMPGPGGRPKNTENN